MSWLRGLDEAGLRRVLEARPDVASPPEPGSLVELADRLRQPGSVSLALSRLTRPVRQAAEALAAAGTSATRDSLARLLGAEDPARARALDAALETLAGHALVWPDRDGTLRMPAALRQTWRAPLGLDAPLEELLAGTTSEELRKALELLEIAPLGGTKQQRLTALVDHHRDPRRVAAVVERAPAETRELLELMAGPGRRGRPSGAPRPDAAARAARWAVERGLLVREHHRWDAPRMPAEVAMGVRGVDWHAPFDPVPPVPRTRPVTAEEVEREAAAALTAFASDATSVLSACAAEPPAVLKTGGVGTRELARVGGAARCGETMVRLVLETAYGAGLLARDGDLVPPTGAYDAWAELEPGERVPALLRAWWALTLTPTQGRDTERKVLPALAGGPPRSGSVRARWALLTAAAGLPAGQGMENAAELGAQVAWHRPSAARVPGEATPFATVVREAELLGVLARGALSGVGAALLADDVAALASATRRLLPPAAGTVLVGADLTAVAAGTPTARLGTLLDSVADREIGGAAWVWRFSTTSVRRALDAGRTAAGIIEELTEVASGPLPQPLLYLIGDAERRHGRARVAPATCVIHGEDAALLAEIAAHRKLAGLGLRRLAPTVLVSRTAPDATLAALRAEGYAPVAETEDGTVRVEKSERRRATGPLPRPRRAARARQAATPSRPSGDAEKVRRNSRPAELAARLRAAGAGQDPDAPDPSATRRARRSDADFEAYADAEETVIKHAALLSFGDARLLTTAVTEGRPVTVEYVDPSGRRTVRGLSGLVLKDADLHAWCHLRDDELVFPLSRIHSVVAGLPD
jgi:hypothetical protein